MIYDDDDGTDDTPIRHGYEGLEVHERAMAQLKPLHLLVLTFPQHETYELAQQMRRASKAIPQQIMLGYMQPRSAPEFIAYLVRSRDATNEMRAYIDIAGNLGYITPAQRQSLDEQYRVIGAQLYRLIQYWRSLHGAAPGRNTNKPDEQERGSSG